MGCYHTFARSLPLLRTLVCPIPRKHVEKCEAEFPDLEHTIELVFSNLKNDECQVNQAGDVLSPSGTS